MSDYKTTMKDLIIAIHDTLVDSDNRKRIANIKTFKKGVLPPLPAFPAISILPMREVPTYTYNGGKYKVSRAVELQIIDKDLNKKAARDKVEDLIDGIVRIIRDDYEFGGECFDTYISRQDVAEPIERGKSIIVYGTVALNCYSFEEKPEDKTRTIDLYECKSTHLISQIYDIMNKYKTDQTYPLTGIKSLAVQVLPPRWEFPLVFITESNANRSRLMAGIDVVLREVSVEVFTKLLDKDFALFSNLDLIEKIKDVLQLDSTLGGAVLDSDIIDITYFRSKSNDLGLVYNSTISFGCQTQEYLREEDVIDVEDKKSW